MEHTFNRSIGVLFTFLLFQSCGYSENDGMEYQKNVTGRVFIEKQFNNTHANLVYAETKEVSQLIESDCLNVYFDSVSNIIYAECFQTTYENSYCRIKVDSTAQKTSAGLKKEKISKAIFDSKTIGLVKK